MKGSGVMKEHVLRLMPNEDLIVSLHNYLNKYHIKAGFIGTCVGSLSQVIFRKGYDHSLLTMEGPFEVVSLEGTVSKDGMHLHASVSDDQFQVYGGHLLQGTRVHNTIELVIIELESHELSRTKSNLSGYKELKINYLNDKCSEE